MTITTHEDEGASGWTTVVGDELLELSNGKLKHDPAAAERLRIDSLDILGQCQPPGPAAAGGRSGRTGLIVGRVQSGKTMSFTAVMAAARDNGYRLIVVLVGTQTNLADQTCARLVADLRTEEHPRRPWRTQHNPQQAHADMIRGALAAWNDPSVDAEDRHTFVFTVLKQQKRLGDLTKVLKDLGPALTGTPLIIDDEADQAGLNTKVNQDERSTIYQRILNLRDALADFTYLQYTATPQGPLLIRLIDDLSPDFSRILTPGDDYVGGDDFFRSPTGGELVRVIPDEEVDPDNDDAEPSPSLHEAMRLFFLGVADYLLSKGNDNRSMMVHPSRLRGSHTRFYKWVKAAAESWPELLNDEAGREQIVPDFERSYVDLKKSVPSLRPLAELLRKLPIAISQTRIEEVNSNPQNTNKKLPWKQCTSWLLVGGQSLDRGYTVEGLTVTYMPRGIGVGNADAIQQRGRFFGYKRPYLGFCRVFLERELHDAYRDYVLHERSMHDFLRQAIASGRPLDEIYRQILISPNLKPTRKNILTPDVFRTGLDGEWFHQHTMLRDVEMCRRNLVGFDAFVAKAGVKLSRDLFGDPSSGRQRHLVSTGLSLKMMYESLLVDLKVPGEDDASLWSAMLFLIRDHLEGHPDALGTIVRMRPDEADGHREIKADRDGELSVINPFAGPSPDKASASREKGSLYPGDRAVRADSVTLQLHVFDLFSEGTKRASAVPLLALWLAEPLRSDVVTLDVPR